MQLIEIHNNQGKSAYIYPMISQEFTQAWFISVLKWKLFEPPAPIRIPLSIPSSQKLISEEEVAYTPNS